MEDRLAPLAASCDHDAIFSLAYLRVTQNVKAAATPATSTTAPG